MRFKTWIQNEISSTNTSMDKAVDQEKHYMMVRKGGAGGGALGEFGLKNDPPKRMAKSPTKGYEDDVLNTKKPLPKQKL
jgi:hypothetical protein